MTLLCKTRLKSKCVFTARRYNVRQTPQTTQAQVDMKAKLAGQLLRFSFTEAQGRLRRAPDTALSARLLRRAPLSVKRRDRVLLPISADKIYLRYIYNSISLSLAAVNIFSRPELNLFTFNALKIKRHTSCLPQLEHRGRSVNCYITRVKLIILPVSLFAPFTAHIFALVFQ
jgi:hypothetical protein